MKRTLLLIFTLLTLLSHPPAHAQQASRCLPLAEPLAFCSFEETTGQLAILGQEGSLTLYRREFFAGDPKAMLGPARKNEPASLVMWVVVKNRPHLAILSRLKEVVDIVDPVDLTPVSSFPSPLPNASWMISPQGSGELWFIARNADGPADEWNLARIDAATGAPTRPAATLGGFLTASVCQVTLAGETLMILGERSETRGPTCSDSTIAFCFVEKGLGISTPQLDPWNRTVADRLSLLQCDRESNGLARLSPARRTLPGGPVGRSLTRSLLACVNESDLIICSGNNTAEFWRTNFRDTCGFRNNSPSLPVLFNPTIAFIDGPASRAILLTSAHAAAFDFAAPPSPPHTVGIDTSRLARPGEEQTWPLSLREGVTASLAHALEGVSLTDGTLRWKPLATQRGEINVTLELRSEGASNLRVITLSCESDFIPTGLEGHGVRMNHEGTHAVVWDALASDASIRGMLRIAAVDLAQRKTLWTREVEGTGAIPSLDTTAIYLLSYDGGRVDIFPLDPAPAPRSIATVRPSVGLEVLPLDTKVVVFDEQGFATYDTTTLAPTVTPTALAALNSPPAGPKSARLPVRTREGWWLNGHVLTSDLSSHALLNAERLQNVAIAQVLADPSEVGAGQARADAPHPDPFGWNARRRSNGTLALNGDDPTRENPNDPMTSVSSSLIRLKQFLFTDVGAGIHLDDKSRPRTSVTDTSDDTLTIAISSLDLNTGQLTLLTQVEGRRPGTPASGFQYDANSSVATSKDSFVICFRDGLFVSKVPAPAQAPLRFERAQSAFVLGGAAPPLRHTVTGGTPPYRFELSPPAPYLSVDPATGDVTLDQTKLFETLHERAAPGFWIRFRSNSEQFVKSLAEVDERAESQTVAAWCDAQLAAYRARVQPDLLAIPGASELTTPIAVPIRMLARETSGHACEINEVVLVDMPATEFARRAQKLLGTYRQRIDAERSARVSPATIPELNKRLDALEEKAAEALRRLEKRAKPQQPPR